MAATRFLLVEGPWQSPGLYYSLTSFWPSRSARQARSKNSNVAASPSGKREISLSAAPPVADGYSGFTGSLDGRSAAPGLSPSRKPSRTTRWVSLALGPSYDRRTGREQHANNNEQPRCRHHRRQPGPGAGDGAAVCGIRRQGGDPGAPPTGAPGGAGTTPQGPSYGSRPGRRPLESLRPSQASWENTGPAR